MTNSETPADILGIMRSEPLYNPHGDPALVEANKVLKDYADRIEAAAKRERDPLAKPRLCKSCKHYPADGCEICGCGDYVESDTIHPSPAPGNAASTREALELAVDYAEYIVDHLPDEFDGEIHAASEILEKCAAALAATPPYSGNASAMREALSDACYAMFNFLKTQSGGYEEMANALDKAKAALAAPPRNCDVGTAEEQAKRQRNMLCDTTKPCPDPDWSCAKCFAEWAQMPYEEGGAE